MSAFHSEEERIAAIRDRVDESEGRLVGLQVLAPQGGRIVGHDLEHLEGQWVERGVLLCEIVQNNVKEILYAVPQNDVETLIEPVPPARETKTSPTARLLATGTTRRVMTVPLNGFLPSAEWEPPHPALSGHLGGPLSVHPVTDGTSQGAQWKLLEPHLVGHVALSPDQAATLRSGERVTLVLSGRPESFGPHI